MERFAQLLGFMSLYIGHFKIPVHNTSYLRNHDYYMHCHMFFIDLLYRQKNFNKIIIMEVVLNLGSKSVAKQQTCCSRYLGNSIYVSYLRIISYQLRVTLAAAAPAVGRRLSHCKVRQTLHFLAATRHQFLAALQDTVVTRTASFWANLRPSRLNHH
jgi:hypothetical protein